MGSTKTFSEVLTLAPTKPNERLTPWEAYLLGLIQNLQKRNALLQQQMQRLEKQLTTKTEGATPLPTAQQEVTPPI
eukprot:c28334_g1_i1 orf=3-227(-)